jgi:hypothetical protein
MRFFALALLVGPKSPRVLHDFIRLILCCRIQTKGLVCTSGENLRGAESVEELTQI